MMDAENRKFLIFVECLLKFIDSDASQEYESLCIARSLEACRLRWQRAEQELQKAREALLKSEIDRSALQVKLKHARNQVDVEMRKRHRAETQAEKMERHLQLIHDLLMSDGLGNNKFLNESLMAFFTNCQFGSNNMNARNRLSIIDESCTSVISHSDISYDQTEDILELDSTALKPARPKPQERPRFSLAPLVGPPVPAKRTRTSVVTTTAESINEPMVTNTDSGGPIQAVTTIEALPRRRSCRSRLSTLAEQTTVWGSSDDSELLPQIREMETEKEMRPDLEPPAQILTTISQEKGTSQHTFTSKTVIRVETCAVCSKRIKFGRLSLKCKECLLVVHPECRENLTKVCVPSAPGKTGPMMQGVLEDFAPSTAPRIPYLVRQCVSEIELRGLKEKGIYRVPGCDRQVKELRRKFFHAKGEVPLGRVQDIHVVCGVLKDFLRSLQEPLVTFQLHLHFMEAADIVSDADSRAELCQAVGELPPANRDTLAFLILHLLRVMHSPDCNMDQTSLARVFGPTIVGYHERDPSPLVIMEETPRQCKVMASLLSVPAGFWNQFLSGDQENVPASVSGSEKQCERKDETIRLFRPLTSPEINAAQGVSSNCCLPNKIRTVLGTPFNSNTSQTKGSHTKKTSRFFTSPNA